MMLSDCCSGAERKVDHGYKITKLSYRFTEEDPTNAVLGLAAGDLSEPAFTKWMSANAQARRTKRSR